MSRAVGSAFNISRYVSVYAFGKFASMIGGLTLRIDCTSHRGNSKSVPASKSMESELGSSLPEKYYSGNKFYNHNL